uniref:Reverse transcriptase domain-containing protein n=1 Tax=Haemonchus contortus TaxID=6289 RepID=A0A7I4Y4A0_HAECO
MRKTTQQAAVGVRWFNDERLTDLDFADDIALIAEDKDGLQKVSDALNENASMIGLRIGASKSKAMSNGQACTQLNINMEDTMLENVDKFTYLGGTTTHDGYIKADAGLAGLQKLQRCSGDSSQYGHVLPYLETSRLAYILPL